MGLRNLVKILFILLCILAAAYFIPSNLNLNHKKKEVSEIIKSTLNIDADVKGDIYFQVIPSPKVFINQVQIVKDGASLELYRVNIRTSFSSILGKGFEIKSLEVENTQFYEEDRPIIDYLFSDKAAKSNLKIDEIGLKNIEYVDNSLGLGRVTEITGDLSVNELSEMSKTYKFKGSLKQNDISYFVDSFFDIGNSDGEKKSRFNLDSELVQIGFEGDFQAISPLNLNGKVKIAFKGNDLKQSSVLLEWLNNDKSTLEADLEYNSKKMLIDNIKVNGSGLNDLSGRVEYDTEFGNILNASVTIKKLDFDKHESDSLAKSHSAISLKKKIRSALMIIDFDLPSKIDGQVKFVLDEIVFNKESIKNINLSSKIIDGKFLIPDLEILLPAKSKMLLKGSLMNNQIRTKFDGEVEVVSDDFKALLAWLGIEDTNKDSELNSFRLKSDLIAIPRNIRLENIRLLIGEIKSMGQLSFRAIDNENIGVKTSLRFDKIDSDKFGAAKYLHTLVTNAFVFDYDRAGNRLVDSLKDFAFLRSFPVILDAEIQVDSLLYRTLNVMNFSTRFNIEPNKFKVDRFNVSLPSGSATGNFAFSVSGIRPEINGQIRLSDLTDRFMTDLFPDFVTLKETAEKFKIQNTPKKDSVENKNNAPVDPLIYADYDNMNFFSLDKVSGNIDIIIDNYNSKELKFDNLNASFVLGNGVIGIPSITANIFDGQFSAIANIILVGNVPSMNTSFQLNNFNPSSFTKYFYNASPIKGYMSLSGGVSASGFKLTDLIGRASGNVTFAGKKVTWLGFDIGEVLKTSEQQISLAAKVDRFNYYSNNGETVFNDVDGVITFGSGFATISNVKLSNNIANGSFASNISILNGAISSVAKLSFIPYGTQIPITISINSKGLMSKQETKIEADQLINFFNQQSRISGANIKEDQSQSLLRNRRL